MHTIEIPAFLSGLPEHAAGDSLVRSDSDVVAKFRCVELVVVQLVAEIILAVPEHRPVAVVHPVPDRPADPVHDMAVIHRDRAAFVIELKNPARYPEFLDLLMPADRIVEVHVIPVRVVGIAVGGDPVDTADVLDIITGVGPAGEDRVVAGGRTQTQ